MDRSAEQLLVRRVCSGDREAAAQLVRAHHAAVYRLLLHLCRDAHVAEDLCQESFAAAWVGIATFNGSAALSTWLRRIAYCRFADWRRRAASAVAPIWAQSSGGEAAECIAPGPGPLAALVSGEQMRTLIDCVDGLVDADREVLVLHYFEGLSFSEMAAVLGRPVGTVKWRVSQALQRLRETFDEKHAGSAGRDAAARAEAARTPAP